MSKLSKGFVFRFGVVVFICFVVSPLMGGPVVLEEHTENPEVMTIQNDVYVDAHWQRHEFSLVGPACEKVYGVAQLNVTAGGELRRAIVHKGGNITESVVHPYPEPHTHTVRFYATVAPLRAFAHVRCRRILANGGFVKSLATLHVVYKIEVDEQTYWPWGNPIPAPIVAQKQVSNPFQVGQDMTMFAPILFHAENAIMAKRAATFLSVTAETRVETHRATGGGIASVLGSGGAWLEY